jgi:Ca-activated chloride channel family protein
MLPVVLFLTDGLPTVGKTSEVAIRDLAEVGNPHGKRVFTFGAGANVNAPLLRGISRRSRATCTFVLPGEDVEVKIGRVFEQLSGPVLSAPELALAGAESDAAGRIVDRVPAQMPDLFRGDQLVVLGKYLGEQPLNFELRGNYMGRQREFEFSFDLSEATTRNGFVARLWASRKIGVLIEAIQEAGADLRPGSMPDIDANPRLKELVDEVVRLSTEFGILTEYTAFLALEGTDLSNPEAVHAEAGSNFRNRALQDRSGWKGVNQSLNVARQVEQTTVNRRNYFLDKDMNRQQVSTVQQVNDVALYRRQNRWVDSRLVQKGDRAEPDRTVEFGSPEFRALARRLSRQGRQGTIALHGEVLLSVQGETVLVRNP